MSHAITKHWGRLGLALFTLLGMGLALLGPRPAAAEPTQGSFDLFLPQLYTAPFAYETGCKAEEDGACGTTDAAWLRDPATRHLVGDFDGDGQDDLFAQSGETLVTRRVLYRGRGDGQGFRVGCEGIDETSCGTESQAYMRNPATRYMVGDFNGDGRDDLFVYAGDAGYSRRVLYLGRADGSGFNRSCQGQESGSCGLGNESFFQHADTRFLVGDFNGNGRDDIFVISGDNNLPRRALFLGRDDGTGFEVGCQGDADEACGSDSEAYMRHPNTRHLVGDFNGDGRDDIFSVSGTPEFPRRRLHLGRADGQGFEVTCSGQDDKICGTDVENYTRNPVTRYLVGDYNGDGRDDIFVVSGEGANPVRRLYLGRSDGQSFDTGCQGINDEICGTDSEDYMRHALTRFMVGDFNGDGRDDIFTLSGDPEFPRRRVHFGNRFGTGFDVGCQGVEDEACGTDSEPYTRDANTRFLVGHFSGGEAADLFLISGSADFPRRVLYLGN